MKNHNREAVSLRFRSEDLRLAKQILKANGRSDNLKAEFKHIILNVLNAALKELKEEHQKTKGESNNTTLKGETSESGNTPSDSAETRVSGASDSDVSSGQAELLDSSKSD
jgi:hypothetical protein